MTGRWIAVYGRCQAASKRSGKPGKMMALSPGGRCTHHGGVSVGPCSLAGRIKALRNLKTLRHKGDKDLSKIAAAQIEAVERRYMALRREADTRKG